MARDLPQERDRLSWRRDDKPDRAGGLIFWFWFVMLWFVGGGVLYLSALFLRHAGFLVPRNDSTTVYTIYK